MIRTLSTIATFLLTISVASAQEVKNIIYLIGDGMGLSSTTMMMVERGYEATIFDQAENIALQKTYSADNRVTDSAASGTALATGFKTNNTFVGCTPDGVAVESLMDVANAQGKATGVVVTTYLQHATPAAFYAHTESRHNYHIITEQLVNSTLDVAIGGGMGHFKERYKDEAKSIITNSGLHENFDFIYAGLQPPNPAELLMSKRLDDLVAECRKHYDYIIIDSVPALVIADAMITSRVVDLSIYVVREGLLERQQLPDINALHTEKKLNNMCIVLNGTSESRQTYGYSYRYQYSSGSDKNNHGWRKILKKMGILK